MLLVQEERQRHSVGMRVLCTQGVVNYLPAGKTLKLSTFLPRSR
jgi:hypothetical protein